MRKRIFLAVLMIAALVLSTGCSLIVKDAKVDAQTPIIEVVGKTITKAEVQTAVENTLSYQSYIYSMYGMSFDATDEKNISDARDSAINALVRQAVIDQKVKDLGFDAFTDDEIADMQKTVDSTFDSYVSSVKTNYFSNVVVTDAEATATPEVTAAPEATASPAADATATPSPTQAVYMTTAELDAAVTAKMAELGYPDKDALLTNQKASKGEEKLKASIVKDVAVTDDDIQTEYDSKVEAAKSSYADNVSQYGTDVSNGTTIYYRPAGYRHVKNILRKLSDADSKAIDDLNTQITNAQGDLDTNTSSLAALPADATADTADQAKSREELNAQKAELEATLSDLNAKLDAAKESAYAALQPTVDEIVAKLNAGEDFDALMAQYGEDTGMQSDPGKTDGYLVCAGDSNWVSEFTEAAMTLVKAGDVSAPFRTKFGIHIVKYVNDVTEGAVPLADVKDTISADLLTTKQDDLYNNTVSGWVTDANPKIYKDRLTD